MLQINSLYHGDCLQIMPKIDDKSIDMILTDLPYGTTACKWDVIIPFDKLWKQYKRIIKDNGAIVLTASQPFTSALVMSNIKWFKYEWIWEKSKSTGYFDVQYRPMKQHENILIFGKGGVSNCSNPRMNYFPQGVKLLTKPKKRTGKGIDATSRSGVIAKGEQTQTNFPLSIIGFDSEKKTVHPTQKPVALFEYLIKTYTNAGDLVLDSCAGVCTTAVAAENTNRRWICIEKELKYCELGKKRYLENRERLATIASSNIVNES
jgi:site-specific DNA-methyltransferase (adenine-specific)